MPSASRMKGLVCGEVRLVDAHRHVVVAGKLCRKWRPAGANRVGVCAQRRLHVETHAVDMDVQLVLRAPALRVDRQADRIAWQIAVCALVDEVPRLPGGVPVVRRVRREDRRAFDSGDARGRHQQELGIAHTILQHDVAGGEIDQRARLRRMELLLVGHALLADDIPERIGIRRGGSRYREQGGRRRRIASPQTNAPAAGANRPRLSGCACHCSARGFLTCSLGCTVPVPARFSKRRNRITAAGEFGLNSPLFS